MNKNEDPFELLYNIHLFERIRLYRTFLSFSCSFGLQFKPAFHPNMASQFVNQRHTRRLTSPSDASPMDQPLPSPFWTSLPLGAFDILPLLTPFPQSLCPLEVEGKWGIPTSIYRLLPRVFRCKMQVRRSGNVLPTSLGAILPPNRKALPPYPPAEQDVHGRGLSAFPPLAAFWPGR